MYLEFKAQIITSIFLSRCILKSASLDVTITRTICQHGKWIHCSFIVTRYSFFGHIKKMLLPVWYQFFFSFDHLLKNTIY